MRDGPNPSLMTFVMFDLNGRAMYAVDTLVNAVTRAKPSSRWVFPDGWGDESVVDLLDITKAPPPTDIDITWSGDEGVFAAPLDRLPDRLRTARVHRVRAAGSESGERGRRVVILLPAWDDETPAMRLRFAKELADRGIGSIMLEGAYYGDRRHYLVGPTVRTFEDMVLLSRAIVEEGRSLVHHFMQLGYQVGIGGFSMGGSLAVTAAALLEGQFAIAALAPSPHSPVLDGVMKPRIDWAALGGDMESLLRERLMQGTITRLTPTPSTQSAVLVAGRYDRFVPLELTKQIHQHWPGSELRIFDAGHATLLVRHHRQLVLAIDDAFTKTFGLERS